VALRDQLPKWHCSPATLDGRNRSTRSRTPLGHPIDRHVAEPPRLEHPSKAGSPAPTDTTINIEEHVMT
jgi:hypothetical protein